MQNAFFASITIALACGAPQLGSAAESPPEPIDIGSRLELFVDDFVIDKLQDARQRLHHPTPREVATEAGRSR